MLTNLVNPALKLALGNPSATITFSTDSTPALQTTVTAGAGAGYGVVPSTAGIVAGDFVGLENANTAGTGPHVTTVIGGITSTNFNVVPPVARVAVSNGVLYRFERIETRYRAKKVTLTNLTNGDVYVWDTTLNDNQAKYTPSGGTTTTITNGILNRSNCICIHPNLLPINSNFSMKCEYDYYT